MSDSTLNQQERKNITQNISNIREYIKQIDMRLIELESRAKELREYDFTNLYRELGVSPDAVRANTAHLSDIKDKADIAAAIMAQTKPHRDAQTPKLTKEEERLVKKGQCEEKIARYKSAKSATVEAEDTPEGKRRMENYYDDLIDKATAEWMKYQ